MRAKQTPADIFSMILDAGKESGPILAAPIHGENEWHEREEGQLALDVAETIDEVVIVSTASGIDIDQIEIYIHNDLLTIRGVRVNPLASDTNVVYHHQECFWGVFSRTVVLPVHVHSYAARAEYKRGVLTIRMPKQGDSPSIPISIVED